MAGIREASVGDPALDTNPVAAERVDVLECEIRPGQPISLLLRPPRCPNARKYRCGKVGMGNSVTGRGARGVFFAVAGLAFTGLGTSGFSAGFGGCDHAR